MHESEWCEELNETLSPKEKMTRRMIAADFPFEVILDYGNMNSDEYNTLGRANHELILEVVGREIQALFDNRRMWAIGEETGIGYKRESR